MGVGWLQAAPFGISRTFGAPPCSSSILGPRGSSQGAIANSRSAVAESGRPAGICKWLGRSRTLLEGRREAEEPDHALPRWQKRHILEFCGGRQASQGCRLEILAWPPWRGSRRRASALPLALPPPCVHHAACRVGGARGPSHAGTRRRVCRVGTRFLSSGTPIRVWQPTSVECEEKVRYMKYDLTPQRLQGK